MVLIRRFAIAFAMLALSGWAGAVEFRDFHWGFDGKVLARHFNLLAVLVDNPGDAPIEGVVRLQEGELYQHGAAMLRPCYLAPRSSRWLQFYPWVEEGSDEFKVQWVHSSTALAITAPAFTAPAVVRFDDGSHLTRSGGALQAFPEELFPPLICATAGLGAAVLDHVPRLQGAQCRTLIDWLSGGGVIIVAKGLDGRRPHFGAELDALNASEARHPVGSGWVLQLDEEGMTAAEALAAAGITLARLGKEEANSDRFTPALLGHFAQIVRPRHDWRAIFLLLTAYLLLIGPIALVAARKKADFRLVTCGYLLAIGACSGGIWQLGKRGYGERDQLNSIGYAIALGDGAFNVTSWNNLFVTASGGYSITGTAEPGAFACPSGESLSQDAVGYDQASTLQVSIPMFSSRSFVSAARRTVPGLEPRVRSSAWDDGGLRELSIEIPGNAPGGATWTSRVIGMRASHAGKLYELTAGLQAGFELTKGAGLGAAEFRPKLVQALNQLNFSQQFRTLAQSAGNHEMLAQAISDSFLPLIAYGLGGEGLGRSWLALPAAPGRVTVFILIEQPQELDTSNHVATNGGMVYRFDLPLTARSAP